MFSFINWLFKTMLFNFRIFVQVLKFLLFSSFISLWSDNIHAIILIF
jgi:hypothetical protein